MIVSCRVSQGLHIMIWTPNTGRNIRNVQLETNKDPLKFEQILKLIKYHQLQEDELYKIHMIKELAYAKIDVVNLNISTEEICDMLQYLCCYWYGALMFLVFCFDLLLCVYFYVRGW